MKINNKEDFKKAGLNFLVLAAAILFYFFVERFNGFAAAISVVTGIIRPFIFGTAIAYLLMPVTDWITERLEKLAAIEKSDKSKAKKRHKRLYTISMFLSILLFLIIITALFAMIIPQLVQSIRNLIEALPAAIDGVQTQIYNVAAGNREAVEELAGNMDSLYEQASTYVTNHLNEGIKAAATGISGRVLSALSVFKDFLIGLIVAVYIMGNRRNFRRQARLLIFTLFPYKWDRPLEEEQTADFIFREAGILNSYMNGFIKGKIIDSFIIGVLCLIFTVVTGMPYAILVSVIVGVTNIIPFFGPFIGAIPSALIILTVDPVRMVVFVIFIIILQQLDGNVIGPSILGSATNLSSFWVLFAILFFGGLFGIPGMILGVPVFGFIYQFVREIVYKKVGRQKEKLKEYVKDNPEEEDDTALSKEEIE